MNYVRIFLIYLFVQVSKASTGDSPIHLRISLKVNIKSRIKEPKICTTNTCNKTAQELLKFIDLEADPCTDFYQFSCGNFLKNEIPPGKSHISTMMNIEDEVNQNVKSILEGPISQIKLNYAKQTKMSFQTCINTTAIDSGSVKALKEVLKKFGGWPLIEGEEWNEEECNLTSIFTKLQLHGMLGIFQIMVAAGQQLELVVVPPDLALPDESYKNYSTKMGTYKQYLINASLYLGEMEKNDNFLKAVDDILDFEGSLAECKLIKTTSQEDMFFKTTPETLKNMFGKIFDVESLFKSFYKNSGLDLKPNEAIAISEVPYFNCLAKLLETTSKRKVVNYMIWYMIQHSSKAMPKHFVEFANTFMSELGVSRKNISRWEHCVDILSSNIHLAVGYLYVMRHFRQTTKNEIMNLVQQLKNAYEAIIKNNKLLDKEAKVAMTSRLEQMRDRLGYPDHLDDPRYLDRDFKGVDFSGQTFLEIFLTLNMLRAKEDYKKLGLSMNSNLLPMPITYVGAVYQPMSNTIEFPAAIMSSPLYADSQPKYLNFGGIGSIIAHEITHGMIFLGNQIVPTDAAGELQQIEDQEKLFKRAECLIKQFDELVLTQINQKLKGNRTCIENMADLGGLRIAYMAYKRWLIEHGEEKQLPGIPYNSEQMFFIAYGMRLCKKLTDEEALQRLMTDTHAPTIFRINMSLKNFKSFSKAFKCKANSEMNISERCREL